MRRPVTCHLSLLALCALCGCSGPAAAQSSLGRQTVHERGIDGAISERAVEVSIDAEGRCQRREQSSWETITDYALDYHSDPEIFFDSGRQTLDVAVARTTQPDGTITETPESGFNELLPRELASAPAYGKMRRTVVSHVGVEPGGRSELDYTVSDKAPTAWSPGGSVTIAGPLPAAKTVVALRSAHGRLRSECVRCDATPTATEENSAALHRYALDNLEALNTYELGAHVGDGTWATLFVPRIVYSTAESWMTESQALARRVTEAAAANEAIRERARSLTNEEPSLWGRIEAVQAFVARAVDTVHFDHERLGYAPPTAEEVLRRSYGSELDKAVLLVALLRALDVEAQVVLVSEESRIATEIPWLGQFQHAWVIARTAGQERWMPVNRALLLAEQELPGECYVLRLDRPGAPVLLDAAAPDTSAAHMTAELRVSAAPALEGTLRVSYGGTRNPYFNLRAGGRGGNAALTPVASGFAAGTKVNDARVAQFGPVGTAARGKVQATLVPEGGGTVLTVGLPWPDASAFERVQLRAARQTPLVLPGPRAQTARITVSLPAGWQPAGLPGVVEIRNDMGWIVQQVEVTGSRVEITRELGLRHRVVEPGQPYAQLHEILSAAARLAGETLILTAGEEPEEDGE